MTGLIGTKRLLCVVLAAMVALPLAARTEQQKLLASDGELFDQFGGAIALEGQAVQGI